MSMFDPIANDLSERFGTHITGNASGFFCVISASSLTDEEQVALSGSANALGFGGVRKFGDQTDNFTHVTFCAADGTRLSPQDLILIVETIDPLVVVVTSKEAGKAIADAYHQQVALDSVQALLGRPMLCFDNLASMLISTDGKQHAWKLLKALAQKQ